jgi:BNR repeat-like domain
LTIGKIPAMVTVGFSTDLGRIVMIQGNIRARSLAAGTIAAGLVAASFVIASDVGRAAGTTTKPTRQAVAKALLEHRSRFQTPALQRALHLVAGDSPTAFNAAPDQAAAGRAAPVNGSYPSPGRGNLANVRVNDPGEDRNAVDQTTQSETSLAVAGDGRVAVGFNDSQRALLPLTTGLDLSGYAYSTDGGRSFTDGGALPNPSGFANLGDPWLGSDRQGTMYYSTLTVGGIGLNLEVGVSRSTNGGRSWSTPAFASPNDPNLFYSGDKDALTTGPDPATKSRDNVYVSWDDFVFDPATGNAFAGLPVARSVDGGRTFTIAYADRFVSDPTSCSFGQYLGAQPFVDPSSGALYVFAEQFRVDDPGCTGGGNLVVSQVVVKSTDGGQTFGPVVKVADINLASALILGPAQVMRVAEFPTPALLGGKLYVAWNESAAGRDHLALATSADGGASWSPKSSVTSGAGDEVQPALTADQSGLHLAYYQRNADNTLDVVVSDSGDGTTWTSRTVTSQPFPGVTTVPQFDPIIAFGYMGDYIAHVSSGGREYFAWGDNRDRVTNYLWPQGRNDPDVFFARR